MVRSRKPIRVVVDDDGAAVLVGDVRALRELYGWPFLRPRRPALLESTSTSTSLPHVQPLSSKGPFQHDVLVGVRQASELLQRIRPIAEISSPRRVLPLEVGGAAAAARSRAGTLAARAVVVQQRRLLRVRSFGEDDVDAAAEVDDFRRFSAGLCFAPPAVRRGRAGPPPRGAGLRPPRRRVARGADAGAGPARRHRKLWSALVVPRVRRATTAWDDRRGSLSRPATERQPLRTLVAASAERQRCEIKRCGARPARARYRSLPLLGMRSGGTCVAQDPLKKHASTSLR